MNFEPFDLENEVEIYFESWCEDYDIDPSELTPALVQKFVRVIQQHDQAAQIYQDLEHWFAGTGDREDVMSDVLMDVLHEQFEQHWADAVEAAQ